MRRYIYNILIILLSCSLLLTSAVYEGKNIDGKTYSARLRLKDEQKQYNVSVVFVGKQAKIVFASNQVLPPRFANNLYLTLHLKDEVIETPGQVPLLELIPPENADETDKDKKNWKIAAYWFMKINLK
mgnify:CR=1 FL=1